MLIVGSAVDYGRASAARSRVQSAVDAAAISAAALRTGTTLTQREGTAKSTVLANLSGFASVSANAITVTTPSDNVYRVTVTAQIPTSVMRLLKIESLPVAAQSEAIAGSSASPAQCVLLMEPSQTGLYVNSDASLDANCGVHVNSAHSTEAILANSNSHITAASVRVKGAARINSRATITPAAVTGVAPKTDPLASLSPPADATNSCQYTDYTVNNGENKTMTPGVYCKKTLINSGGNATMQPGVYVFREGEFEINSDSTVTGTGVMIYFHDKDARLNVNSGSTFNVSAPTWGDYAGMLIFQGRAPANSDAPPFIVNSNSKGGVKLEGTIYLPLGTLELNSFATANQTAAYTAIVARNMVLNSFGVMNIRSNFSGSTPLPTLLSGWKPASTTVVKLVK